MTSLGQLNHVLTNQNVSGSYTTDTWTCTQVVGQTSYYSRTGHGTNTIQYDPINGWADYGSDNPNLFRTSVGGTVTNPPTNATVLYLYNQNSLFAVLNTGYTSGSGGTGGTGGNSGTPTPTGTVFYDQPFDQLYFRVYKTSPLSSATSPTVHYAVYHDGSYDRTLAHGNPNVDVTTVETNPADGLWQLIYLDDTTFVVLGSYTIGQRKRSLTFWE